MSIHTFPMRARIIFTFIHVFRASWSYKPRSAMTPIRRIQRFAFCTVPTRRWRAIILPFAKLTYKKKFRNQKFYSTFKIEKIKHNLNLKTAIKKIICSNECETAPENHRPAIIILNARLTKIFFFHFNAF